MPSIDLKRRYRDHYTAKSTPAIVDVPRRPFLMIDGAGDPNTSREYREAIEALYPIAYGLRAAVKAATGEAYTMASEVIPAVTARKDLAGGTKARMEHYAAGTAGQVLHTGPYADEAPTIAELHDFITGSGYKLTGKHHEIYLPDARRVDPAKLRTIIRQPFTGV